MGFNTAFDPATTSHAATVEDAVESASDSSSINIAVKRGSTDATDNESIATSDDDDQMSPPSPPASEESVPDHPMGRPLARRPYIPGQPRYVRPTRREPSHTQTSTTEPWNGQPVRPYPPYSRPAASYPYHGEYAPTYPTHALTPINHPYYGQPPGTYPSYVPSYVQPATSYPYYVQPGGFYPPYTQAGPGYLPNTQYLSSYVPYTHSMFGDPSNVQRPLAERPHGHEGIPRRDIFNSEHSKPNRLLRFSIHLRSNKEVIKDEESGFYKGEYPLFGGSGRQRHSTKENSNAKHFDIVSTQCLPAEDGCQTISLVLMDEMAMSGQKIVRCESHWRHLNYDILSFDQLYEQATEIEGVQEGDLAIVAQLLNKVQKTFENKFVDGRYLKPTTVVYDGEGFGETVTKINKTATFVSLPVFWLQRPRERKATKDSAGHPSRALLQSRYRLETTEKRDQEQVIAKSRPNEKRIVHVPQIWALIINRNIIITCAPFDASVLCGDSIKTIPYAVARVDEATWSVHFRDTDGNPFYLPLRLCKTWFGLVKYISSVCLDDRQNRIRDELLSEGPLHKIVTEHGAIVNGETWPGMVEAKGADLIHLKLISGPVNSIDQGNASSAWQNPDPSSFNSDTEDHDLDDLLGLHPITTDEARRQLPALEQLRHLQNHLRNAILQAEGARVDELKGMQMPVLEALIHELTTDPAGAKWCNVAGLENVSFLRDPSVGKINVPTGARPGLQNTHGPTISYYDNPFTTLDDEKGTNNVGGTSPAENANETDEVEENNRTDYCSQVKNISEINETKMATKAEDNDEAANVEEIQAAESHEDTDDFEESSNIQAIYEVEQIDETQEADEADCDEKVDETDDVGEKYSVQEPGELDEPDPVNPFFDRLYEPNKDAQVWEGMSSKRPNRQGGSQQKQPRTTKINSRRSIAENNGHLQHPTIKPKSGTGYHHEKPRLKKLLKLAKKEVYKVLSIKQTPVVESFILPFEVPKADHLPIFLWSTGEIEPNTLGLSTRNVAATCNPEELILHTILKEGHAKLRNMSGGLLGQRENAVLYEIAESKTALEVNTFLFEIRRRGLNNSYQEGVHDHISRENAEILTEKGKIFDLSDKILHAFVPRECESPLVNKYWGSVFGFLAKKDGAASRNLIIRLEMLWPLIQDIHRGVHTTDGSKQVFHIPQALPTAFQQLVMFFVFSSGTTLEAAAMMSFESCKALLLEGKKQLILMTHTFDLRGRVDFKAVDPQALLALMMSNLVTKISPEDDCDLTEIYSEYALKIQHMVRDRASVQVYDNIKLLQEEIDVIKAGLVQQQSVLRDFKSIIWESRQGGSLTTNVFDRVLESIEQRIEDFDELQVQADNARFLAAQSISLKEENNSKAILVFTVTTIIFLPLSFVTSYLGMNTSDLRSTSSRQSIFWIVGVPLTLIILGLALVLAFFRSLQQRALRVMKWLKDKYD